MKRDTVSRERASFDRVLRNLHEPLRSTRASGNHEVMHCAEVLFSVIHDHHFLKCLLIDNTTPTPSVVESTGVTR